MKVHSINLLLFLSMACGLFFTACESKKEASSENRNEGRILEYPNELTFVDNNNRDITALRYATAKTSDERNQGLMDVRSMPADAGMVFFFEEIGELSFWMLNTPLPLDIIYVNEDSVIVSIYHNAKPFSDKPMPSGEPARYVIETNGGFCINYDIKEGNKVRF